MHQEIRDSCPDEWFPNQGRLQKYLEALINLIAYTPSQNISEDKGQKSVFYMVFR
jgi:hypothetical protein